MVADRVRERLGDKLGALGAAAHEGKGSEIELLERAQRRERKDDLRECPVCNRSRLVFFRVRFVALF